MLGSAAGGGFPQWNCNCRNCSGLRRGSLRGVARTQSSISVTSDSKAWALVNASPDLLHQIRGWPQANPARSIRDSSIAAIILVDGQIDHAAGLLLLREGSPLNLYTTAAVREDLLEHFPVIPMLEKYCGVNWLEIQPERILSVANLPGLQFRAIPIAGKAPPYSPARNKPRLGDNIALAIEDTQTGRVLFYAPGLAAFDDSIRAEVARADCVMIDGTFWIDDELIQQTIGHKRASDMGHLALSGDKGLLAELERFPHPRRILVHINNTNPILDEDSPERRMVEAAGIEIAYDGMEIDL
ncbi:MAG TPA: pyrroloquinoline quinone biosynthesis protein PqqB [Candidatus Binataceae bacterium]|nr:pyrroloquinoline quinone biosynthesis protein PqqB [Candidatus Binataceae bacterium]